MRNEFAKCEIKTSAFSGRKPQAGNRRHYTECQDDGERAERPGLCVNGLGLENGHRLFPGDRAGDFISVTGTVGIEADGPDAPTMRGQTRRALEIIVAAIEALGARCPTWAAPGSS